LKNATGAGTVTSLCPLQLSPIREARYVIAANCLYE
jgi:hypothetical protein